MPDFTYVIGAKDLRDATSVTVKIGHATDPKSRCQQFQTGNPHLLEVIKIYPNAGNTAERALHTRYSNYRKQGEWFQLPAAAYAELLSFDLLTLATTVCSNCGHITLPSIPATPGSPSDFKNWLCQNFDRIPDRTPTVNLGSDCPTVETLRQLYVREHPWVSNAEVRQYLASANIRVAAAGKGKARRKNVVYVRPKPDSALL